MNRSITSIQIDLGTRRDLKALKGEMTYDELLLRMIKMFKGRLERNKFRTPEKIRAMRKAIRSIVDRKVTIGENGRIKEIDISE